MSITRRLFGQLMAAAPVVAPAAAQSAVDEAFIPVPPTAGYAGPIDVSNHHKEYLKGQVEEMRGLLKLKRVDEQDRALCWSRAVKRLDPDIKALRSFSAVAKTRMQAERNEARMLESNRAHWKRVLQARLTELAGLK